MKSKVDVFKYKSGIDFLNEVYRHLAVENPGFSQRNFAKQLGMDQSMLARYFSGERLLAFERLAKVAIKLKLGALETEYYKLISTFGDRGDFKAVELFRRSLKKAS